MFLNRVLDASTFPIPECQEAMEQTRKIGLGIMGFHDMLIQLGLPYDSLIGRDVASNVMQFINDEADRKSQELGKSEGYYGGMVIGSPHRRNANLTTIAPTGTLSMIADCSSGCEPYFASVVRKNVLDGESFTMYNKWIKIGAAKEGITESEYQEKYSELFKDAHQISWSDHVEMQAAFQNSGVDSSISKTINMSKDATKKDVRDAYELAYRLGCKGVTVYRDGCKEGQVLSSGKNDNNVSRDTTTIHQEGLIKWDLPDVLEARRYRIKDSDGNKGYLIVCFDDDNAPMEVFHKQPFKDNDVLWSTVCRSVSLSMRFGIPLSDIVKQLRKSSGSISDLPAQLSRILSEFLATEEWNGESCPECESGNMMFTSGCSHCPDCGYSKCQ